MTKRPLTNAEKKQIVKKIRDEIANAIWHDEKDPRQMSDEELGRWFRRLLHEYWPQ